VSDLTKPFGPNWAIYLLPYLEQQNIFNSSNTLGYPGIPGPFQTPDGNTVPNANQYNMDWANVTVRSARINAFVCPSDSYNDPGNNFMSNPIDLGLGITPTDQRTGLQLTNWARGSYGAVEGGTDSDHTVNGNEGRSNQPNKGTSKRGAMGVNFGITLAANTDGTSNTAFFSEMRTGLATIDIRGTWALGMAGASLCCETRPYNPTPNAPNWAGPPPGDDGGDELQTCFFTWQRVPSLAAMGMPCNTGTPNTNGQMNGFNNSGGQARSLHPGGVNVCLGDGSVRFIKNSISNNTWFSLIVSNDTWIVSADQY
jgi:prepilin-type processing-associated H-X9-DG protein